jgi:hypothetical protein
MSGARRRTVLVAIGAAVVGLAAVLAFGVFGVHTLFVDETVDEAGPDFRSGATATSVARAGDEGEAVPVAGSDARAEAAATPEPDAPVITEAGRGAFAADDHPGEGTAVLLTDGEQTFVRFEDDFATDNGPDLFVVVYVDGERIELDRLKGNRGAQNYELPTSIDPASVEAVAVWCKRFDSTFTTAPLA